MDPDTLESFHAHARTATRTATRRHAQPHALMSSRTHARLHARTTTRPHAPKRQSHALTVSARISHTRTHQAATRTPSLACARARHGDLDDQITFVYV